MSLLIKDKVDEQMSEGLHNVTITNVEDLGLQATHFGTKDMAAIYFTADDQKGRPVACMKVTKSLHVESRLSKLLSCFSIPVGAEFDLRELVGVKCEVVIQHKESNGKTDATIAAVLRVRKAVNPSTFHSKLTANVIASRDGRFHSSGCSSMTSQTSPNACS
jgi:hypothetical protein